MESGLVDGGAAQVKNGAGAEFVPTHAGALHALLHEVFGATFDGATTDRQAESAEQRILHAQRVGGEVAALPLQHLDVGGGFR